MKRLVLALVTAGTAAVLVAAPANAAGICINADLNVNGTAQTVSQCLPPA